MNRLFAAVSAVALTAAGARAATLSADPASLVAQVKAARPGDIVRLAPGAYGAIGLNNIAKAAPGVTIQGAPGAVLTSLEATGSSFLIFNGLEVAGTANAAAVYFGAGSHDIVFRNGKVHQADNATLQGSALIMHAAANVTVDRNEFSWLSSGVGVQASTNAVVSNNSFHDIGADGIDITDATNLKVIGNTATDFHPGPTTHPDFIQWWETGTVASPCGMDVEDNRFDRGAGKPIQGVFGEAGCDVTIRGNILRGAMFNGIGLSRTQGAVIADNFVDGYPDMVSRIIVRGGCADVSITNNAAQVVANYMPAGQPPCRDVKIAGNTTLTAAAPGDDRPLDRWLSRRRQEPDPGQ